jgi:hypothetical protein
MHPSPFKFRPKLYLKIFLEKEIHEPPKKQAKEGYTIQ